MFLIIASIGQLYAENLETIQKIKKGFAQWQPIINKELSDAKVLYHYTWGKYLKKNKWSSSEIKSDQKILVNKIKYLRNKSGHFIYSENYSISGDWFINSETYYDNKNRLYFVFWNMNTFQAETPLSVERRLYFDEEGYIIRNLEQKYKMNTKEKSDSHFSDRKVQYETKIENLKFFKYLQ